MGVGADGSRHTDGMAMGGRREGPGWDSSPFKSTVMSKSFKPLGGLEGWNLWGKGLGNGP